MYEEKKFEARARLLKMAIFLFQKVEIAVADMALTVDRQEAVEFTQPFFVDDLAVVMARSTPAG